jgi:hypothetical protein
MMSKRKKEKYHKNEDMGSNPKESYPFPLLSNGERNTRRERLGASVMGGVGVFPSIPKGKFFG